jgi:hypothetical protein
LVHKQLAKFYKRFICTKKKKKNYDHLQIKRSRLSELSCYCNLILKLVTLLCFQILIIKSYVFFEYYNNRRRQKVTQRKIEKKDNDKENMEFLVTVFLMAVSTLTYVNFFINEHNITSNVFYSLLIEFINGEKWKVFNSLVQSSVKLILSCISSFIKRFDQFDFMLYKIKILKLG